MTKICIKPDKQTKEIQKRGGRDYTRELVRQRDKRTCQMCRKVWVEGKRRFDVHHLYDCGYKSKAYDRVTDIPTMITYCHRCHINLHGVKLKILNKDGQFKLSREARQHQFYRDK